jgi:hypothetical protein
MAALELVELEGLEHQESALGWTAVETYTEVDAQSADDSVGDDPQTPKNTKRESVEFQKVLEDRYCKVIHFNVS